MKPTRRFDIYLENIILSISRIYEYLGIDYEMIWTIAKENLPQNKEDIQFILETERNK